jgi:hypothetical protein
MSNNNPQSSNQHGTNIENLVSQSRFIFKGEVKKLNDATLSFGKITESTNISRVKVSEIIHAPKILGNYYAGKEITLQLSDDSQKPTAGHQSVFFTYPWVYGNESIAVQEVGRLDEENTPNMRNQITDAIQNLAGKEMKGRIKDANLIVIGKVTNTSEIEPPEGELDRNGKPFDEDEKLPYQADIEVEEVIKGNLPNKKIKIQFDNNMDFSSYQAPKFKGNEYGVFFLKKDKADPDIESYSTFNQGDFQSISNVDLIKQLIKSTGGQK